MAIEPGVHRLAELTFEDVRDCDPARTVAMVPIAPLEEHGPHLPLGVDAFDAVAFAEASAEHARAERPDLVVLILPPYCIGHHVFAFPGTIGGRQRVVRDLAVDVGGSLARSGVRYIVYVNAHGGPGHIVALEEAAAIVSRRYGVRAVSPSGVVIFDHLSGKTADDIRGAMSEPFSRERSSDFATDLHAGWWETSMMLHLRPDLVRDSYRGLADAPLPYMRVRPGIARSHGGGLGYMGYPARASADMGRASLEALGRRGGRLIVDLVEGRDVRCRWPWHRSLPFRTNLRRWAFVGCAAILTGLYLAMT